jgi:hypothetical protein
MHLYVRSPRELPSTPGENANWGVRRDIEAWEKQPLPIPFKPLRAYLR